MHDIEPYFKWRDRYTATHDERSPFFGRQYSEFLFTHKIYNYFIHPQWDEFGSSTLYTKILYVDYKEGYAILEMFGEWNDCLHNDIMFFKREVIDMLIAENIFKFVLICDNVLNFHAGEEDYYEEWQSDIISENGWIVFVNTSDHVEEEMLTAQLSYYSFLGTPFQEIAWRTHSPKQFYILVSQLLENEVKRLRY